MFSDFSLPPNLEAKNEEYKSPFLFNSDVRQSSILLYAKHASLNGMTTMILGKLFDQYSFTRYHIYVSTNSAASFLVIFVL